MQRSATSKRVSQMIGLAITFLLTTNKASAELKVTCLGTETADRGLIYLHGIRSPNASLEIKEDEELWRDVAAASKVRVAMIESDQPCKLKGQRCWPAQEEDEVANLYRRIREASDVCFKGQKSPGLVGFSNGGYFAIRVVQYCLDPKLTWILTIGSLGDPERGRRDLAACPKVTVMTGSKDLTRKHVEPWLAALKRRKARVDFQEYKGGHVLPKKALINFLESQ